MTRLAAVLAAAALALAIAVAIALAIAGPAASQHAATPTDADARRLAVSIGFDSVTPSHVDIVRGETVTWTNSSARVHTATADDESFDSGRMGSGATFSDRFATAGEVPYHCTLHTFIRGVVDVHDLLLDAPARAASPRLPFPLSGRSALPAATTVTIEADSGSGYAPVTTTTTRADGTFVASIVPATSAIYRAVAGDVASPPTQLLVLDRRVALRARRARRGVALQARVSPPSRGGRVVLQLYLPEHFGWWPVQAATLDGSSRASFTLRTRRRVRARVLLTLPDGATALAVSRVVRVGPAR